MKTIKILIFILVCITLYACPTDEPKTDTDMQFSIKNDTEENIFFYANTVDTIVTPRSFIKQNLIMIKPNKSFTTTFWTELFEKNKKLNILIYKQSTLDSHTWKEIQDANLFDKRYVLTLEELKAMDYTVSYTGE